MLFDDYMKKTDWVYKTIDTICSNRKISSDYMNKKFIRAMVKIENTSENPKAVSHAGARGMGQVMREAWNFIEKKYSYDKYAFNPYMSLDVGIRYMIWIDEQCKMFYPNWKKLDKQNKQRVIAASYNGGIFNLMNRKWNLGRMKDETVFYIIKIQKKIQEYEAFQENLLEKKYYL